MKSETGSPRSNPPNRDDVHRAAIEDGSVPTNPPTSATEFDEEECALNEQMANTLRRVHFTPGGSAFIAFAEAFQAGETTAPFDQQFGDLVRGLASVTWRASQSEDTAVRRLAQKQLKAADRIVCALDDYELLTKKIDDLLEIEIDDALLRAWDVLEIMRRLSFVLLTKPSGKVELKPTAFKPWDPELNMIQARAIGAHPWDAQLCGEELLGRVQDPKFWTSRSRPTLKSLAIKIYLDIVGEGAAPEETLYEDLRKAAAWQTRHPTGSMKILPRGITVGTGTTKIPIDYIPLTRTRELVRQGESHFKPRPKRKMSTD